MWQLLEKSNYFRLLMQARGNESRIRLCSFRLREMFLFEGNIPKQRGGGKGGRWDGSQSCTD